MNILQRSCPGLRRAGICSGLALCLGLLTAAPSSAQDENIRYVGGSIQLGLHAQSRFDSEVLALLPTGTKLELVELVNGIARVRDPEGREGWVDAKFVVETAPGEVAPVVVAAPVDSAALDAAREQLAAITRERDELAARLERTELESSVAAGAEATDITPAMPDGTLAELESLATENVQLKRAVEVLQARSSDSPSAISTPLQLDPNKAPAPWLVMREWGLWMYVLLGCALLFSFACGAAIVQWDVRRRHGGFRV